MISPLRGRSSARRARDGRQIPLGTLVVLTLLLPARRSDAQSDQAGRVEGVVFDSVHARPFAGAHVVAVGTGAQTEVRREAVSDASGRYRIDSLPAGRYIVGFESALLDSLEVALSPREASVAPGQIATLDLALPSAAKLRSAVCLGAELPPGTGVIYGHVVNAETESPFAGVKLAMAWQDLTVDRTGKRLRPIKVNQSSSVVTDADGWYRMCGVPTGAWVSMQIQLDKRSGPVLRALVDDTLGITIRHLSLATGAWRASDTTANSPVTAPLSGTATLTGFVRGPGDAPVASAEVRVRGTRAAARTDARGTFTLGALPAGTQELEVRRIGFALAVVPVELRSAATTTTTVLLRRIVNLDSVLVVASRPKYPDFYVHKSSGFGRFFGPEEIGRQRVSRTSDIIEKIPGFRVEQRGYHQIVQGAAGDCRATLVIDGVRVPYDNGPSINDLHPAEIGAIEAYSSHVVFLAPPEYGSPGCGLIAIWTKR